MSFFHSDALYLFEACPSDAYCILHLFLMNLFHIEDYSSTHDGDWKQVNRPGNSR